MSGLLAGSCGKRATVESLLRSEPVLDDSCASALAAASDSPAQFPEPAASADERALLWSQYQSELQGSILIVGKQIGDLLREDWRLNESHTRLYAIDGEVARSGFKPNASITRARVLRVAWMPLFGRAGARAVRRLLPCRPGAEGLD